MAATLRRHGSKGDVLMDPTGGSSAVHVASLNGWTADFSREAVDVTAFLDTTKVFLQGTMTAQGTVKGWWEAIGSKILFDAAFGDVAVFLKLVPSTLDTGVAFSGPANLSMSIEVAVDGAVTVNGTWSGAGPWSLGTGIVATGATAGTPGTFTPAGADTPANLAAMTGKTANPATAWTTGQHVVLGDASKAYWNATAWVAGQAA